MFVTERAKIFRNGGSQAVRLPKSCRFRDEEELVARRVGNRVVLEPADQWSQAFLDCLGAWKDDIPRPPGRSLASRKNPFDRR